MKSIDNNNLMLYLLSSLPIQSFSTNICLFKIISEIELINMMKN